MRLFGRSRVTSNFRIGKGRAIIGIIRVERKSIRVSATRAFRPTALGGLGGQFPFAIEAKTIDVVPAYVVINFFFFIILLALFSSRYHLAILLKDHRLSHLLS